MSEPLTVGSLFTGIGGIDLGCERAGMQVAWQVEIDPWCSRVLEKHWPNVARYGDVKGVGSHNLAPVDVIAGGFPCQDISIAGRGGGLAGERSGLWFEMHRIVRELRPRFVLVENVSALTSRGIDRVVADLAEIGYDAEWHCVSAGAVGAPHQRLRLWIVAWQRGSGLRPLADADDGSGSQDALLAGRHSSGVGDSVVADADRAGRKERRGPVAVRAEQPAAQHGGEGMGDATGAGLPERRAAGGQACGVQAVEQRGGGAGGDGSTESRMGRGADGVSDGLDGAARWPAAPGVAQFDWEPPRTVPKLSVPQRVARVKAMGNAVVPQVVEIVALQIVALAARMDADR